MHLNVILITIALLLTSLSSQAAPSSAWCQNVVLQGLTPHDGLSDLLVNAIHRDSLGLVWIGTSSAVDCYDGHNVETFPLPGDDERRKRVQAIATTADYRVFVGNGEGLWRLEAQDRMLRPTYRDVIDGWVYGLKETASKLYVASANGLYIIDLSTDKVELMRPQGDGRGQDNRISALALDGNTLWMAGSDAIFSMNLSDGDVAKHPVAVGAPLGDLAIIGDKVYIATHGKGLQRLDLATGRVSSYMPQLGNIISALSTDGNDALYVGTDGLGVFFISVGDDSIVSTLNHQQRGNTRLRSNSVYSLLVDRDGLVWVGYYQDGLDYTLAHYDLFETYASDLIDTSEMSVRSLAIDGDDMLIGTREGLYYVNEAKGITRHYAEPVIGANMIFAIQRYGALFYIGTYGGGLYVFDPKNLAIAPVAIPGCPERSGSVFSIIPAPDGNLWIGTDEGITVMDESGPISHFDHKNSRMPRGNVYEIFFDSSGAGWICTEEGVCAWDGSTIRDDIFPNDFPRTDKIREVYETTDHTLFFMPDRGQVIKCDLNLSNIHRFTPRGLFGTYNGSFIFQDNTGHIWFGSSLGLTRCDSEGNFRRFCHADGIKNPLFTLCKPVVDDDGDIWIGNNNGLLRFDHNNLAKLEEPRNSARITNVYIGGNPIALDSFDGVRLTGNHSSLTIHVSNLSFESPTDVAYECMLEGYVNQWMWMQGKGEVNYFDLPAGTYTFRVRSLGDASSETTMRVRVGDAFPWWLWLVLVVLIVLVIAAMAWRRTNKPVDDKPQVVVAEDEPDQSSEETVAAEENAPDEAAQPEKVKYRTNRYSEEMCQDMHKRLVSLMEEKRPYTNPELGISELSSLLDLSSHTLSYLFNQYLNTTFYDFVNEYRISMFKNLVAENKSERYTLTAMSEMCGFSSRASFFRSFKKQLGVTPKEYINNLKNK